MHRPRHAFAVVLGLLAWSPGAAAQSPGVAVTAYRIALALPAADDSFAAVAQVAFTRGPGADALVLDLVGLTVDSVTLGPDTAGALVVPVRIMPMPFTYDERTLRIPLPPARGPADADIATVCYHGVPRDGLIMRVNSRGRRSVFADNWPERVRYWMPTVDTPAAKARVAFAVRAPAGWRVVANGAARGAPAGTGGAQAWVESRAIPPYTMVVGAGEFTVSRHRPIVHGRDTVPIEVWAYAEDSAFADDGPFRRATEIVEVMERLVAPFPYEKLAHVQSATRFGGMENASAIFYDERAWSERRMTEAVVRHETAHQWFGDAVTERDWHDLWLSEGFASYFDLVIGAALDGDSVLTAGLRANAARYFQSPVVDRPIVDTAEHDLVRLLNANNYEKGSWVLAMLRGQVGDAAFWDGIRAYYRAFRDSSAESADLQRALERAAGEPLGWFFEQWLHQPGYPMLTGRWHVLHPSPAPRVTLALREAQPAAWGVFRLPRVTLEFLGSAGARARRTVSLTGPDTALTLSVPFVPTELRVDPDHALLMRATVVGP